MLELITPNISHKEQWEEITTEWNDVKKMPWIFFAVSYDFFLIKMKSIQFDDDIVNGIAKSSLYFLVDTDLNYIIGLYWFRHNLKYWNDKEIGGHIGYGIRPSERGKGYATQGLNLLIDKVGELGFSEVYITCDDENIASWKVIERNGGILEKNIFRKGVLGRRYRIHIG